MGRSRETFGKKEKDKKLAKKRLDKAEKKADRKANSNKGKSFEDMLAYVDENGNLSSTPPDPNKVKKIAAEEIRIDVARQQHEDHDAFSNGVVIFFNTEKGFGFIRDENSGEEVFVHINALSAPVKEKDQVIFKKEYGPRGTSAVSVSLKQPA